jgi:hypothetical protein
MFLLVVIFLIHVVFEVTLFPAIAYAMFQQVVAQVQQPVWLL